MNKQINWKYILLLIVSFLVLGYVVFTQRYSDVQINKYEDIDVVKENKAIQNGWVPAILPDSAYEITETHDLDKNTLFGSFKYKENDEEKFIKNLTVVNDMNNTLEWGIFFFRVDKKLNQVKFRNKPVY
ncbi:MAG: hypothetical protein U9R13_00640 [Campylobacterota bacterium]|nr:hypothetical protein [Campylobacterota bacterium]